MADPTPEAVHALAKVLCTDKTAPCMLHLRDAKRILADPSPLLAALAEAGVLEVEEDVDWCDAQDEHYTAGFEPCDRDCNLPADHKRDHECVNGVSWPRCPGDEPTPRQRRLVSPWKPVSGDE